MANPQTKLDLFAGGDELTEFIEDSKPWEQERPIDHVMIEVNAKRKTLPTHMSSKLQLVLIAIAATTIILFILWLLGVFKSDPSTAYTENEKTQMRLLKEENQQLKDRESTYQKEIGDKTLTADITRFKGQTRETPGKSMVNPAQLSAKLPPPPVRRHVRTQNTVRIPRRWSNASPPYSLMARRPVARPPVQSLRSPRLTRPSSPQKPSLDSCIGYFERNVSVPECASYRISKKTTAAEPIVNTPQKPASRPLAKKPVKLAFNPTSKPVVKSKPSYQVNYAAGEIQTVDQFQEEFYGTGDPTGTPQLSRMEAKVIDHVEWLTPEDAQKVIIPLKITSGSQKGQTAEAKIGQINGLQFTAYLVSLNGQEVEPEKFELRRQNTKYLRADLKHQGGESFGDKVLGTVTAIGGEIASDQLANVRGGNHLSRLVPNSNQRGQEVTQYWRFDGKVEIVPVN